MSHRITSPILLGFLKAKNMSVLYQSLDIAGIQWAPSPLWREADHFGVVAVVLLTPCPLQAGPPLSWLPDPQSLRGPDFGGQAREEFIVISQ